MMIKRKRTIAFLKAHSLPAQSLKRTAATTSFGFDGTPEKLVIHPFQTVFRFNIGLTRLGFALGADRGIEHHSGNEDKPGFSVPPVFSPAGRGFGAFSEVPGKSSLFRHAAGVAKFANDPSGFRPAGTAMVSPPQRCADAVPHGVSKGFAPHLAGPETSAVGRLEHLHFPFIRVLRFFPHHPQPFLKKFWKMSTFEADKKRSTRRQMSNFGGASSS
jgi:hypothetical protein